MDVLLRFFALRSLLVGAFTGAASASVGRSSVLLHLFDHLSPLFSLSLLIVEPFFFRPRFSVLLCLSGVTVFSCWLAVPPPLWSLSISVFSPPPCKALYAVSSRPTPLALDVAVLSHFPRLLFLHPTVRAWNFPPPRAHPPFVGPFCLGFVFSYLNPSRAMPSTFRSGPYLCPAGGVFSYTWVFECLLSVSPPSQSDPFPRTRPSHTTPFS